MIRTNSKVLEIPVWVSPSTETVVQASERYPRIDWIKNSVIYGLLFHYSRCRPSRISLGYVDDILIFGDRLATAMVKKKLASVFKTTDLGTFTHFFCIKLDIQNSGTVLRQSAYVGKILTYAGVNDFKPSEHPLPMSRPLYEKLEKRSEADLEVFQNVPYSEILGMLLFLSTRTLEDLSMAVSLLEKFQSAPTLTLWKAIKSVFGYLWGTIDYGILLPKD